jgi:hypothetical protein
MAENVNSLLQLNTSSHSQGTSENPAEGGYFSFRKMISTSLIKFLYVLGAIIITLTGLVPLFGGLFASAYGGRDAGPAGALGLLFSLVWITVGNLLWRILCESWILLFSVHEVLVGIHNTLRRNSGTPSQGINAPPAPQPVEARRELDGRSYAATADGRSASGPFIAPPTDPAPAPPSAPPPVSGRTCPRCGTQLRATASFCGSCGSAVGG